MTLFAKDLKIEVSYVYGAYLLIKHIKKKRKDRISFYEASEFLSKNDIFHYRQQFFCLMFLFSTGVIEFNAPYIEVKHDTE